ncbi:hypothetical protein [Streptosporangium canum]|uniref:hypothetical protein n=1 Tax=Streptosporangium canum TaxID=324952 RepID=UPI0037AC2B1F
MWLSTADHADAGSIVEVEADGGAPVRQMTGTNLKDRFLFADAGGDDRQVVRAAVAQMRAEVVLAQRLGEGMRFGRDLGYGDRRGPPTRTSRRAIRPALPEVVVCRAWLGSTVDGLCGPSSYPEVSPE